ncbi:hypothetical protein F1880_005631 [Penicillium rolfsii]|nr:hypothetical protein F1880_005631 [Penicillium rolfsii]
MAPLSGDGVLWLCLGVSLVFAVRGIIEDLRQVVDLTEIKDLEKEDKIISEGTEDVLKLNTLLTLSENTSYDLRSSALRIISERSLREQSRDLLLEDLTGKNKKSRDKALTALFFLVSDRALSKATALPYLQDLKTFTALTTCLCNFIEEHTDPWSTTISPILPKTRPLGENKAIEILWILLPGNVSTALEAGLVSRWLTNYPFPCVVDKNRKEDVVILVKTWWSDDEIMSNIFDVLTDHPEAKKQLREHGLMGPIEEGKDGNRGHHENNYDHDDDQDDVDDDEHGHEHGYDDESDDDQDDVDDEEHGEEHDHDEHENWYNDEYADDQDDADDDDYDVITDGDTCMAGGATTAGPNPSVSSRFQFSAADQALRRRRREAMVLSEGGRPLGHEDIIQRPIQDD